LYFNKNFYFCIEFIKKNYTKMTVKKYKRKQHLIKALRKIESIKKSVPKIVFKANNLVVTLKNKRQLNRWLEIYPEGTYSVNY